MPALPEAIAFQRRPVSTLLRLGAGSAMFRLSTLAGRACVIAEPALAHEVLHAPTGRYRAGAANRRILPVLPQGTLLTLDGAEHRARRRQLAALFHGDALTALRPAIQKIAETEIAAWPQGEPFAVLPRTRFLTLSIAARLLLGVEGPARVGELQRRLGHALRRASFMAAIESMRRSPSENSGGAACCPEGFARVLAELRNTRLRSSAERRPDAVDLLAGPENGAAEQWVMDELFALLLAGHETTASALAWALELVARDPRTAAALAEEASADERPLLDSVIAEVLRLRAPLVDIVREVGEPTRFGDQDLDPGALVLIPPPLIHLHVQPAPTRFLATRFLGRRPEPLTWLPFGGGDRRCLGASLAQLELREILAYVLDRYKLEPATRRPETARLHGTALVPSRGGRITLLPRRRSYPPM